MRTAEGEGSAAVAKEQQRGVNSLDGKVKRNHLNTPRYANTVTSIHMVTKPGQLRWTHLSGDVRV